MNKLRILILNRWADDFACYDRYIDHQAYSVAYITTPQGKSWIPTERAEAVRVVNDLSNSDNVREVSRSLIENYGRYDRLFAPSEYDLDLAAHLREIFRISGPRLSETSRVRDKVEMKRLVAAQGLRVPEFIAPSSVTEAIAFARSRKGPVVLKPRRGAASQGVVVISSESELKRLLADGPPDFEIEDFTEGDIYHADGLVVGGQIIAFHAGKYVNSCLDWARGMPLGSVGVADDEWLIRIRAYADSVLGAVGLENSAFHLEFFYTTPVPSGKFSEFVFLEVAARIGGGEILFVWRDVYRYDLLGQWIRLVLNQIPERFGLPSEVAGWVEFPHTPGHPCRIVARRSMRTHIPELYEELLPTPDQVLDGSDPFGPGHGRFRLRARCGFNLEPAVRQIIQFYEMYCEPLVVSPVQVSSDDEL